MNNKRRILFEKSHDAILKVIEADHTLSNTRHKLVERKLAVKPDMMIVDGRIYYDYTSIMLYAWETGQEARIRKDG